MFRGYEFPDGRFGGQPGGPEAQPASQGFVEARREWEPAGGVRDPGWMAGREWELAGGGGDPASWLEGTMIKPGRGRPVYWTTRGKWPICRPVPTLIEDEIKSCLASSLV